VNGWQCFVARRCLRRKKAFRHRWNITAKRKASARVRTQPETHQIFLGGDWEVKPQFEWHWGHP
jgi:hypothetical protein